jgi:hypothetical protein
MRSEWSSFALFRCRAHYMSLVCVSAFFVKYSLHPAPQEVSMHCMKKRKLHTSLPFWCLRSIFLLGVGRKLGGFFKKSQFDLGSHDNEKKKNLKEN